MDNEITKYRWGPELYDRWGHRVVRRKGGVAFGVRMRKRYAHFTRIFVKAIPQMSYDEAALLAARESNLAGIAPMRDEPLLKRAKNALSDSNVREAIANAYEIVEGFTVVDAVAEHVKHIKGFTDDNQAYHPPSYQALKDYQNSAFPKAPKESHVQVDRQSVTVTASPSQLSKMGDLDKKPEYLVRDLSRTKIQTSEDDDGGD